MKVAVIGTGYVGLVSGASLAHKGHTVICVDKRSYIVEKINAKLSPIYENGLDEMLKENVGKRLHATESLMDAVKEAEVIIIAVGTPYIDGSINLEDIKQVSVDIGFQLRKIKHYTVITVKSTVLPTVTESVILPILERESGKKAGSDFGVCMNPEFLREGNAVKDFLDPDRIVIGGIDNKSCLVVKNMYSDFDAPIILTNPRTAEMIKYTSNSLLATIISFSNEVANICCEVGGIDIEDVMEGVHLDHRLNPLIDDKRANPQILTYIKAGCGFGGSCFPKDVNALISFSKEFNFQPTLLESVIDVNKEQPLKTVRLLKKIYPELKGLNLSVLGLSFKPDTDDIRESPAIVIIKSLLSEGASVKVYDPIVKNSLDDSLLQVEHMSSWKETLADSDAVIVTTKWREFEDITQDDLLELMRRPVIVDARRMFKKDEFSKVKYCGIGINNEFT